MKEKTNAMETPDARLVGLSKQLHALSAPGAFSAFREDSVVENYHKPQLVDPAATQRGLFVSASEESDGSPVAGGNETAADAAWRIIGEWNLDKGYVSTESLLKLSKVLHPEVQQ